MLVVLGACAAPKHQSSNALPTPDVSSAPDGLAELYGQQLEWTTCDEGECATAQVPADYADPSGPTIQLALARIPADGDDRIGSLLVNPGGPGGSGVDSLTGIAARISADVLAHYDIVSFDPRGVQHSVPAVACLDDADMDAFVAYDADYSTPEGLAAAGEQWRAFGAACLEQTGPELATIDTISAARDLDLLRAALGDDTLHYLGYSYGTQLGATYAALFPQTAGRLVLDGAVDPTVDPDDAAYEQAVGFENALRAYVTDCQGGPACPLTGSVDHGLQQIHDLLDRAYADPLPTGTDRRLTRALAFYGVAVALYDDQYWPTLTAALTPAIQGGDGSILLMLSDAYTDRQTDGTYASNSLPAFWSISCLDGRPSSDPATMASEAERILADAPTLGESFAFGGVVCAQWPAPEIGGLDDYSAAGAPPILVIGTTNDPATPYKNAQALADLLDSGTLLTFEGEGHTAYGRSNDCITDNVDAFLLEGTVPAEGTVC
ncbi:alpha/beta hydrolase [Cellulomonas composti]|uniref:Alpha/beta hydrolase n=1 Tax=Cellulomonas composti TaxID=266130 RepID=A0A511JBD6_9CELL|nr:alpha/beta hydrolase [Cellulomonas composti]